MAVGDELIRQLLEQARVGRRIVGVHVVNRVDQPATEEMEPCPVDDGLREEWVVGRSQPCGEHRSVGRRFVQLRRCAIEGPRRHDLGGVRQ